MRAVTCRAFGPPSGLAVEERPDPEPAWGEALVRFEAWGCNFVDALMVAGGYQLRPDLPFTPGLEAAGRVEALGEHAEGFRVGDAVVAGFRPGAFAELAAVSTSDLRPVPEGLGMEEAAVFRSAHHTALHALMQRGRLRPGETVLVHGAGGGVGLAAVQCARLLGARTIATAGSEEKLALARAEGAEVAIDHRGGFRGAVLEATGGRGADMVLDPVGGDVFDESLRCVAWGARILAVGFASGRRPEAPVNRLLIKGVELIGVRAGEAGRRDPSLPRETWRLLSGWAGAGLLRPHVGRRYPFSRAADALQALLDREVPGKAVLIPDG